tara:strand:+ start:696 stop:995 length:300 start_codon:yes stop_codon:yes gene_type:complete
MKFKLKSGKEIEYKDLSIDEQDELQDLVKYRYKGVDKAGNPKAVGQEMLHSNMTKWIRKGVKGGDNDKFIRTLSFEDKVGIFAKMQEIFNGLGEEHPSE